MFCNIDLYHNPRDAGISPEKLLDKLDKYDVISFDLFDTLIFRPFTSPRVLFFYYEE
jgi:hypothetical protein